MEKAAFIDIFTTHNDLYGKHNCPIQFSVSLTDENELFTEENLPKTKTINIIPDEDILSYGTYVSGKRNDTEEFKEAYVRENSAVKLETALQMIYSLLGKLKDGGFYIVGFNHINFDMKILNEHFKRILNREPIEFPKERILDIMDCAENLIPVDKIGNYSMDSVFTYCYPDKYETLCELKAKRTTAADIGISKHILCGLMKNGEKFSEFIVRGKGPEEVSLFNFGKYKGMTLKDVFEIDQKYLNWILNRKDFQESKMNLVNSIKKLYNEREEK